MGIRGYKPYQAKPPATPRPVLVSIVAALGVVIGLALAGATLAMFFLRQTWRVPIDAQVLDIGIGMLAAIVLIRLYWAVWERTPAAWWAHVVLGPFLVVGLLVLATTFDQFLPLMTRYLSTAQRTLMGDLLRGLVLSLAVVEALTIFVVFGARKAFDVGREKQAWEKQRQL